MKIELLEYTKEPELIIEKIARISHASEDKFGANPKFISKLLEMKHFAILEFASATFIVSEVSRSLTHQLVRHRQFSFMQKSQRFVNEDTFDFVTPPFTDFESNAAYEELMNYIQKTYRYLIHGRGVPKEDARFVLPNACHTKIAINGNFRTYYEFLQKRLHKSAQWEIKALAKGIHEALSEIAPNIFLNL